MTTTESYLSTQTSFLNETATTTNNNHLDNQDPSTSLVSNVTIDELVQSCCSEVLPSSSQINNNNSASPTHLVRFVHSQSSLLSQIDEQQCQSEQISTTCYSTGASSHETPTKHQQTPLINVTRLPSPFKPKTIIESTNSMQNTTNLSNITANNISVNNYNVNIHTTNVQQPQTTSLNDDLLSSKCSLDEKQTTEIVSQILKNIKEVDSTSDHTTNYNIHIDSFNFSSSNEQQNGNLIKKSRVKKEAKALTRIIVKDEIATSPNASRTKKPNRTASTNQLNSSMSQQSSDSIAVPYGWQRRILASDLVVYLSPTNVILDSFDAIRRYLEMPTSCKCGLQCPLIVEKVFNFDSSIKSKSWEVTQVLEGTHCRQKSNILEMATLTNCIDSFCEAEQKTVKRRKRPHSEVSNGNVFVCASNSSNLVQTNLTQSSTNESVVILNSSTENIDGSQPMTWASVAQAGSTPPSKRPRGRPRKTAITPPVIAQLAVKPNPDNQQPVPSSILSPPASVSSTTQNNIVHRNSTSPSTHLSIVATNNNTGNLRYLNDNVLTPSSTSDTNVIARVPALFDQVKSTTNESTFSVLSGVQNVLLSPNRDITNGTKRVRLESSSSIVSTTTTTTTANPTINSTNPSKPVTLNINALKPDFVRSPANGQKPCQTSMTTNQIDVISLVGAVNQTTPLLVTKTTPKLLSSNIGTLPMANNNSLEDSNLIKVHQEQNNNEPPQTLMIDFNDPSTTNFLLSALASGASSDSNAIVNHLFQKAQSQQRQISSPPAAVPSQVTIRKKLPIVASTLKNCTETTNLLPIGSTGTNTTSIRTPVVLHVPSTNSEHQNNNSQNQQIIFSSQPNEDRKQAQQIFFINNKPYVIQQKLAHDQSSQQRLVLTPSLTQTEESSVITSSSSQRTILPATQSSLDDGGNCLVVNGLVEPRTLSTLLKGLNSSSFSGVDNLIDTINRLEHSASTGGTANDNLLLKPNRTKASPAKKAAAPSRRRVTKKAKQDEEQLHHSQQQQQQQQQHQQHQQQNQNQIQMGTAAIAVPQTITMTSSAPAMGLQSMITDQNNWQSDFNSFDFSTPWGSDTNLNSLLLNDDFDTAASFDDVNFGDFEPYMNGNNNANSMINDTSLPSLFVKPLPPDSLPSVDHLLP